MISDDNLDYKGFSVKLQKTKNGQIFFYIPKTFIKKLELNKGSITLDLTKDRQIIIRK